ncbi:tyrosine-type recombinase/integrase [Aquimarina algiphila]|uniref:Tyrosine-type recombinase/integrase n=1 Tax=Aquimarina algiphila TaxID=2047982 RepID=A0A554VRH0_9FLAO|nr:tyrosine-type recombinase/integrase [Aquimarina algiphila]TSE11253.1 tyrosine-type recombinase/integrase [Aquimarina algiphila]
MCNVYFRYRSKKDIGKLDVRFRYEEINYEKQTTTPIIVSRKNWNQKKQRVRTSSKFVYPVENTNIAKLKKAIYDKFNTTISLNEGFHDNWLSDIVEDIFKRPEHEKKNVDRKRIYYVDFAKYWLKHHAKNHVGRNGKLMSKANLEKYIDFIDKLEKKTPNIDYENLKIKDMGNAFVVKFVKELFKKYAAKSISLDYTYLRFFLSRAVEDNIEVDKSYLKKVAIEDKKETVIMPYLTSEEVETIYRLEIEDKELSRFKTAFVIGLVTGLRVSDVTGYHKRINEETGEKEYSLENRHIEGNHIRYKPLKTRGAKGGIEVSIPIHPFLKEILEEHNGLPDRSVKYLLKFNNAVKTIIEMAGITRIVKTSQKKFLKDGIFEVPIYKEATSHIMRQSAATNLFGKVPKSAIMAMMGWTNEDQMLEYIKLSGIERVKGIKELYDNGNESVENLKRSA